MTLPQTSTETTAPTAGVLSRAARRMLPLLAEALWRRPPHPDVALNPVPEGDNEPVRPVRAAAKRPQQRGGLFRKYAALLLALVGGSLIVSAAIEMYYSWSESRQALIAVQREKAQGAATIIEQFVKEIEGQVGWATGFLPAGSGLEQRRFDFLRLLRQAPAITEVSYLDADGREQIKVSRLAMDTLASGADQSQEPKFKAARANKRYLSPVYFRKESEPYITLATAGVGRSAGVAVAEVNLKFILDDISRIHVGHAGVAYVVDERGLLIAHPDIGLVLRKTDLSRLPQVRLALNRLHDAGIDVPAVSRDQSGREVLPPPHPSVRSAGWCLSTSRCRRPCSRSTPSSIVRLACSPPASCLRRWRAYGWRGVWWCPSAPSPGAPRASAAAILTIASRCAPAMRCRASPTASTTWAAASRDT